MANASYSYDGDGQRTGATVFAPSPWSATATETAYTYSYDGLELRWMTATSSGANARLTYLYDEQDRPYAASYEATVSGEPTTAVFALLTTDHGDVVGLVDSAGTQFARYTYGPFGEAEEAIARPTDTLSPALAAQITAMQPLRYAAYTYDTWSGTYYLQARHYDPVTKQFLTKDPAEADGEESAYQYCAGDPVNQDDPDGEFAQVLWGAAGGAAWYAGERAIAGAWKARSVFKKQGFRAGMRATWRNVRSSWSWKSFGREVAIGAATGGLGMMAGAARAGRAGRAAYKASRYTKAGRSGHWWLRGGQKAHSVWSSTMKRSWGGTYNRALRSSRYRPDAQWFRGRIVGELKPRAVWKAARVAQRAGRSHPALRQARNYRKAGAWVVLRFRY